MKDEAEKPGPPYFAAGGVVLHHGDCLAVLPTLQSDSIDAVITDPPYPEINRPYGRMTEQDWMVMMKVAVKEVRRVLTPTGSAVFVLQPNSRKVGSMRSWLWEFMAWACAEWNMVQDAWWWNYTAIPSIHATQYGLMRGSVKACVWLGPADCYRDQSSVLWRVSDHTVKQALDSSDRWRHTTASGWGMNRTAASEVAVAKGGSTPYNLLPVSNARGHSSGSGRGHGASTPLPLCDWWVRYLTPPGGTVLDPFVGSATVGVAALGHGHRFVGIDRDEGYLSIAKTRLQESLAQQPPA